jgi:hypothetical protein
VTRAGQWLRAPGLVVVLSALFWAAGALASRTSPFELLDSGGQTVALADYRPDAGAPLAPLAPSILDELRRDAAAGAGAPPAPSASPSGGPAPTSSPAPSPTPTLPVPTPTLPVPTPTLPLPTPTLPVPTPSLPLATPTPSLPLIPPGV